MQLQLPFFLSLVGNFMFGVFAADFTCPREDILKTQCMGPKDCLYPYSGDCNKFILCEVNADGTTGRISVKDCPSNLEWNNNTKMCDWPDQSTCRDQEQESLDTASEALPPSDGSLDTSFSCTDALSAQGCMSHGASSELECIYENPAGTDSYIQCTDEVAYTVKCSSGETYNDAIKACE